MGNHNLPEDHPTQPMRLVPDSQAYAGDGTNVYPYHGQPLPPGHFVYLPAGPGDPHTTLPDRIAQIEQAAGPVVSVRYHSGANSDGDPYERVEVDFHHAPPSNVLLAVLEILLTTTRETVITRAADGGTHLYGEKQREDNADD